MLLDGFFGVRCVTQNGFVEALYDLAAGKKAKKCQPNFGK
jgi:hypothetical protein